ncbi:MULTISPECIES: helix-turn-helix transcriptional regulator [Clostridium]|uniref:YheO-like PAS domain protein n=2 Tax=Clostridium TaxID=1485 RepID=A0A151AKA2_9CLOT|nr:MULTISPECIES: PAS domain-containing protein [Clostridium]KYH28096.1 YheO-like PAS domain protein [Clostridium colicanis DSM 13634]PRR71558.1 YheO-like PAS domain protein [Clostridium thermopalmarium DSM 5974]PVZ20977.1 putative transcriptional regulator YheO [Clostridium thermopalmarium DSM 5974]
MNILNHYVKLVKFLGITLGPDYEIALYDVRDNQNSIIAIANGHITGRSLGSPLSTKIMEIINNKEYLEKDFIANYNTISNMNNKLLRSSILFIKDNDELVGILAINFDDSKYSLLSKQIMELCHPHDLIGKSSFEAVDKIAPSLKTDIPNTSIEDLAKATMNSVLNGANISPDRLKKNEKMEIVKILNDKGIFSLKDSVTIVAKLLHSSEATIYRYLHNIRKEENSI